MAAKSAAEAELEWQIRNSGSATGFWLHKYNGQWIRRRTFVQDYEGTTGDMLHEMWITQVASELGVHWNGLSPDRVRFLGLVYGDVRNESDGHDGMPELKVAGVSARRYPPCNLELPSVYTVLADVEGTRYMAALETSNWLDAERCTLEYLAKNGYYPDNGDVLIGATLYGNLYSYEPDDMTYTTYNGKPWGSR